MRVGFQFAHHTSLADTLSPGVLEVHTNGHVGEFEDIVNTQMSHSLVPQAYCRVIDSEGWESVESRPLVIP